MLDNSYTKKQIKSLIGLNVLLHFGLIMMAFLIGIMIHVLQWDKLSGINVSTMIMMYVDMTFFLQFNNVLIVAIIRLSLFVLSNICFVILYTDNTTSILRFLFFCHYIGILTEVINGACNIVKIIGALANNICVDFCMYRFVYSMLLIADTIYLVSYFKLHFKSRIVFSRIRKDDVFNKMMAQEPADVEV